MIAFLTITGIIAYLILGASKKKQKKTTLYDEDLTEREKELKRERVEKIRQKLKNNNVATSNEISVNEVSKFNSLQMDDSKIDATFISENDFQDILIIDFNDDSIIDVTDKPYQLDSIKKSIQNNETVPYWQHQYVYSYSEINGATVDQRSYYYSFKRNFLNGVYCDLKGNTNYAFILLFDLLNDYESHKDIIKLEKYLNILGHNYPKTKSYGISFLNEIIEKHGNSEIILKLTNQGYYENQINYNNYDYWRLGEKYKQKLNLNESDVNILNKIWSPTNNFCSIEFCCIEVIKLYLNIIKELENIYTSRGLTSNQQFNHLADVVARKHFKYRKGSANYSFSIESNIDEIYSNIFKICENAVREHYGHKRKINTESYFFVTPEAKKEYESIIVSNIIEILPSLLSTINALDEETEVILNGQNTNRWKIEYDKIINSHKGDSKLFFENIIALGKLNVKNPSIENIFFEASKFIAKTDNEIALLLYIHYLNYDLKSVNFDNKQFSQTIQKSLFKTNEQLLEFNDIVSEFISDKDLTKALKAVSKIYEIKRKKIQLDTTFIKEVQQKHIGTVELLNEYFKDDDENLILKANSEITENVNSNNLQKGKVNENSIYLSDISLNTIQLEVLEIFFNNNLSISVSDFEAFAKSKSFFKNQLIESINETCYTILDDILIDEDEIFYTINENYYQKLLVK